MVKYYPVMIDISNKSCVVIGGGKVAERKVLSLLRHDAKVTVISPNITEKLKELQGKDKIKWMKRAYQWGDLHGYYLVYIATDNKKINERCLEEAREENVLVNVVDQPAKCNFIVPASIRRGDLHITVSTNGKSPMLSKKIREDLEETFGEEYVEYIKALGDLRKIVLKEIDDVEIRKKVFQQCIYSDLLKQYKSGEIKDIKKALMALYNKIMGEF